MSTKPLSKPEWATGGSAAITEPSGAKKALGWVVEKPPHQFFNWLLNLYHQWIEYFEDKTDELQIEADATDAAFTAHDASVAEHGAVNAVAGTGNDQTFTGANTFDKELTLTGKTQVSVATPDAGKVNFFIDSATGLLMQKTSAGVISAVASGPGISSGGVIGKTALYTIISGDDGKIIAVDTSGGAFNLQLPAPSAGFKVSIKDVGGALGSNPVVLLRNGAEKIEKLAADFTLDAPGGNWTIYSDGTDWFFLTR